MEQMHTEQIVVLVFETPVKFLIRRTRFSNYCLWEGKSTTNQNYLKTMKKSIRISDNEKNAFAVLIFFRNVYSG